MSNLWNKIRPHLKNRLLILGVGNMLRCDDGFGVVLARRLKRKTNLCVWEVGVGLENYLKKIVEYSPQTLLILEAIDFGGSPGEIQLWGEKDLNTVNFGFTHNTSILLAINYLKTYLKVNIIILSVQPEKICFGRKITSEVKKSIKLLEEFFIKEIRYAQVK